MTIHLMITHQIGLHSVLLPFLIIYMELWIFLECILIKISISNFIRGAGEEVDFYVNKWIHGLIPKAPLKIWTFMPFTIDIFYNLIFCQILLRIFFVLRLTILDIGKRWKMVKVLNSTTQSICVTYSVFGLCILHDTNLVLSGSHHQDTLLKNALYMSKIDYSLFKYDIFPLFLSNRDNILHITECVI